MQCPYCRGKITDPKMMLDLANLSDRRRKIVKAILAAGPTGIHANQLMAKFFKGRSYISVRTVIHYINKEIEPMQIVSRNKTLRLKVTA